MRNVVMVLCVVACGGEPKEAPPPPPEPKPAEPAERETVTPDELLADDGT